VEVSVVCCLNAASSTEAPFTVAKAFLPLARVKTILLSEAAVLESCEAEVHFVARGTKLSKLRQWADVANSDLACICDPDIAIDGAASREVMIRAMESARGGSEVVAYGLVEGRTDGSLLSKVVALDKWFSHRVLRPLLWSAGVGITLPGQFMIVSPQLLRRLKDGRNLYLEDLYVGLTARVHRSEVIRVPVVVGCEAPRTGWTSLLAQRIRWMRGWANLVGHLASKPSAVGLLVIHYLAYHGVPMASLAVFALLAWWNPLIGFASMVGIAGVIAWWASRPLGVAIAYLLLLPPLHAAATLLWWIPLPRSALLRR
jgi:hypothetical protein